MATEKDLNQDDDQQPQSSGNQPIATGGGTDASAEGTGGAGTPVQGQPRSAPSSKPNLQSYIKANQSAGQNLATGINSNTNKQSAQFNNQLNSSNNQLNQKSQSLQKNLGDEGSNLIQQSFKDPSAILQNQDQLSQFQKLRDQGYQGDISNLQQTGQQTQSQLQSQVGNLQNNVNNAQTEAGRFQLLRNSFGQPSYSTGQQKLDQLFLQAQPGATNQVLANSKQAATTAANQLGSTSSQFQNKLNALNSLSSQNARQIQDQFIGSDADTTASGQGNLRQIANDANAKLAADQAKAAALPQILGRLKTPGSITDEDIANLGLTKGQSTYGVDLSKYLNQTAPTESLAQAATPEEFARYNALNQLAGNAATNPFGTATEAGGYDPYGVRSSDLQSAVDANKNLYEVQKIQELNAQQAKAGGGGSSMFHGNEPAIDQASYNLRNSKDAAEAEQNLNALIQAFKNRFGGIEGGNAVINQEINSNPYQKYLTDLKKIRSTKIGQG